MARVHRLEHVERLGAADLADQDAVGAHPQAVAQQLADRELALALDVGRPVLERDDMRVVDLQLRGVFDRDHTLVVRDEACDHVERGRLARARAAGDEDVHATQHRGLQELRHRGAEAALAGEVFHAQYGVFELADGERGAVDGGRPDDRVDAAAVRQAGVHHRVEAVDMPAGRRDHAPDRFEQLILVLESHLGLGEDASALDEDLVGAVHHDLAHRPVVEEAVERPIADGRPEDDVGERRLLWGAELDAVLGQEAIEVRAHRTRERERVACSQAHVADQREAVTEVVREPVEVTALAGRRFHDVAAAPVGNRHLRGGGPGVDKLHLQQRGICGHRGDHPLALGEADLDREPRAVGGLARFHVSGDPFAVAEPQDRFARGALVAGVLLQVGIVERAEDYIFDVARGNPAGAIGVGGRVDGEALGGEDARIRLPIFETAVEAVHRHLHTRAVPRIGTLHCGRWRRCGPGGKCVAVGWLRGLHVTHGAAVSGDDSSGLPPSNPFNDVIGNVNGVTHGDRVGGVGPAPISNRGPAWPRPSLRPHVRRARRRWRSFPAPR